MARPKEGHEKRRPERIAVWVSENLKNQLLAEKSSDNSIGDQVNKALEMYFAKRRKTIKT